MKSFDSGITTELAKEAFSFYWLLELGFTTTLYRTDCDIPITTGGKTYTADTPFTVDNLQLSGSLGIDSLELSFTNVDLVLAAIVLNEDIIGDGVTLSFACLDSTHQPVGDEALFLGYVDKWTLTEPDLKLTVVNELVFWNKRTLRRHSADCPWSFKGTECAYAGAEAWCDQTYSRCASIGNSDNFGGFRWLASIMEKEITWGR